VSLLVIAMKAATNYVLKKDVRARYWEGRERSTV
jgi:hypothetical protein